MRGGQAAPVPVSPGGHRGTFAEPFEAGMVGTAWLLEIAETALVHSFDHQVRVTR